MLPTRFWAEMAWTDFKPEEMGEAIAVLPVAAVEQHGPHLPLGVDLFLMQGYIERVADRLPSDLPVLFLPIQSIGTSIEHRDFPGTLSLSATSLMRVLVEIGTCVHRTGCRKLILLNSHGGNVALLDSVAHELRAELEMFVVMATWHRFGYPDGLFSETELAHGIHAGDIETSLMLSFRPDLVRMEEAEDFESASVVLGVKLLQTFVLRSESALAGGVHDEQDFALVVGERLGLAVVEGSGEVVDGGHS